MDVAREVLSELRGGHGVVCAVRQTAGRGRQGRSWVSQEDALMVTFLFSTTAPLNAFSGYSLAVGVSLADAFQELGSSLLLKWPNDLVRVRGDAIGKLGGVLIEVQDMGTSRVLLVGIGINLASAPEMIPQASSIQEVRGEALSRESVLEQLSRHLLHGHYRFMDQGGFSAFRSQWESYSCLMKGRTEVSLDLGERQVSGVFAGVDDTGAILLSESGAEHAYHSGHTVSLKNLRH
jgi:BirA family biotin operon repressor/biotin-[acetyl-CoA-carboxylase] ligase